ncbi:hypothetical protein NESM_000624600 [Novymonas esmeraldas]|uniref:Uncharacterized protein n=1 Tax=Novymonas esmeraldas TaxID=1808958 RepID=A0AAW0ETH7_9TRYP
MRRCLTSCVARLRGGRRSHRLNTHGASAQSGHTTCLRTTPVTTARRQCSSGGGALSLMELAKAFQQLGDDAVTGHRQRSAPPEGREDSAASCGQPRSHRPPSPRVHTSAAAAVPQRSPLLALSADYADRLATADVAQLCAELEVQLTKRAYSSILQCLQELVRRAALPPAVADVEDRRSAAAATAASSEVLESERLLTTALSGLSRMDVYALESATQSTATPPLLSRQLSALLLHSLSRHCSRMDAAASLRTVHLLAQQSLVHSEAALETLVDTIVVHMDACNSGDGRGGASAPFTLSEYSVLMDALSRYQAQLFRLSYLSQYQQQRPGVVADAASDADALLLSSAAAAMRRRAMHDDHHPLANSRVFHHASESLTRALTHHRHHSDGNNNNSGDGGAASVDRSACLMSMSPTSVLFLVRALGKLTWWNDGLAAALVAPLTEYVRAHPETVIVVVLLMGRPEHRGGDAALLEALQSSLLTLLSRRHCHHHDDDDKDSQQLSFGGTTAGLEWADGHAHGGGGWWDAAESDEIDGGDVAEPRPLSTTSQVGAPLAVVDVRAISRLLPSLTRLHVRTTAAMAEGEARTRLEQQLDTLMRALLDDTANGVASLDALVHTLSPAALSKALLVLLASSEQLRQARSDTREPAAGLTHHALVIELAYAWLMQVSQGHPPPRRPPPATRTRGQRVTAAAEARHHRVAATHHWRRVVAVHHALVTAGIVGCASATAPARRVRFAIAEQLLQTAPRVRAAVATAKDAIDAARRQAAAAAEVPVVSLRAHRYASDHLRAPSQQQQQQQRRRDAVRPAELEDVFRTYSEYLCRLL